MCTVAFKASSTQQAEAPPRRSSKLEVPSIRHFLRGKNILISGATGFLAKALVEKILYEQPDVEQLYLLVRPGKGLTGAERIRQQVLTNPAYARLRQRYGDDYEAFMMSKLTAVEGDLGRPNMSIAEDVRAQLQEKLDVVVNSAANTVFDERYDRALKINTLGARDMAAFAAGCKNLELLVHVSTCFTNGMRCGRTPEQPFELNTTIAAELGWEDAPELDVWREVEEGLKAEVLARDFLREEGGSDSESEVDHRVRDMGLNRAHRYGWQDTYVFTKAMGEMLVGEVAKEAGMPTVILRPAIVEGAWKEPVEGWIEGIRMCDPIIIAYGKGQLPGFPAEKQGLIDVIPVDHVVNATLASMAYHAQQPGLQVYQVASSGSSNPLTLRTLADCATQHFAEHPMARHGAPLKLPPIEMYDSSEDMREALLKKLITENGTHSAASQRRQELIARKTMEYTEHLASLYTPYTFYGARFVAEHTRELYEGLQGEEKEAFAFDVTALDWNDYITNTHIRGLREFALKQQAE
ncbi:hypothetical protein N2152v2_004339 [Parachlorella kessleri]